jgi:hypothetical protein
MKLKLLQHCREQVTPCALLFLPFLFACIKLSDLLELTCTTSYGDEGIGFSL